MAVEAGDEAAAKYLIEQGADTDRADRNGVSALAAAAARGDFSLFEAVAAASKADLKAPQLMDKALDGGNVKIVKLLLERGAMPMQFWCSKASTSPKKCRTIKTRA